MISFFTTTFVSPQFTHERTMPLPNFAASAAALGFGSPPRFGTFLGVAGATDACVPAGIIAKGPASYPSLTAQISSD
jgi:hypothetical protein